MTKGVFKGALKGAFKAVFKRAKLCTWVRPAQNFRSASLSNPRENGPGSLSPSLSLTFLFLQLYISQGKLGCSSWGQDPNQGEITFWGYGFSTRLAKLIGRRLHVSCLWPCNLRPQCFGQESTYVHRLYRDGLKCGTVYLGNRKVVLGWSFSHRPSILLFSPSLYFS